MSKDTTLTELHPHVRIVDGTVLLFDGEDDAVVGVDDVEAAHLSRALRHAEAQAVEALAGRVTPEERALRAELDEALAEVRELQAEAMRLEAARSVDFRERDELVEALETMSNQYDVALDQRARVHDLLAKHRGQR